METGYTDGKLYLLCDTGADGERQFFAVPESVDAASFALAVFNANRMDKDRTAFDAAFPGQFVGAYDVIHIGRRVWQAFDSYPWGRRVRGRWRFEEIGNVNERNADSPPGDILFPVADTTPGPAPILQRVCGRYPDIYSVAANDSGNYPHINRYQEFVKIDVPDGFVASKYALTQTFTVTAPGVDPVFYVGVNDVSDYPIPETVQSYIVRSSAVDPNDDTSLILIEPPLFPVSGTVELLDTTPIPGGDTYYENYEVNTILPSNWRNFTNLRDVPPYVHVPANGSVSSALSFHLFYTSVPPGYSKGWGGSAGIVQRTCAPVPQGTTKPRPKRGCIPGTTRVYWLGDTLVFEFCDSSRSLWRLSGNTHSTPGLTTKDKDDDTSDIIIPVEF